MNGGVAQPTGSPSGCTSWCAYRHTVGMPAGAGNRAMTAGAPPFARSIRASGHPASTSNPTMASALRSTSLARAWSALTDSMATRSPRSESTPGSRSRTTSCKDMWGAYGVDLLDGDPARCCERVRSGPLGEDVEVVLVVHQAEHVAEWIDDRCGDEAVALLGDRCMLRGAQCQHPLQGCLDVVDVPVDDRAGRRSTGRVGRERAGKNAELMLVVTDAELQITRAFAVVRAVVVGRYAEQLAVPLRGCRVVFGEEVDGAQSSQHVSGASLVSFLLSVTIIALKVLMNWTLCLANSTSCEPTALSPLCC